MSDELTRRAIVAFNGAYADGLTVALQAVVAEALEEAALMLWSRGDFDQADAVRALIFASADDP